MESYRYKSASGKVCRIPIVGPESARAKVRERVRAEGVPYPATLRIPESQRVRREGDGAEPQAADQAVAERVWQNRMLRCRSANEWCRQAREMREPEELWLKTWYEGEVCCLFADSNLGKSIYAVQIAEHVAGRGRRVLYFDFELSDKQFQLRYTDGEGELHSFPETFFRADMKPDGIEEETVRQEQEIVAEIEDMAVQTGAEVIVIDNITYLNSMTENADAASDLMMRLLRLKKRYGWSILALAHTPKRLAGQPLGANDLAGSKRLFNFFDSVLAIGRSYKDESLRYVKQIKVRYGGFVYDSDNVIVCEIVKEGSMLCFKSVCTEPEKRHLLTPDDEAARQLRARMEEMRGAGKCIREIARELRVSYSKVQRMLARKGKQG